MKNIFIAAEQVERLFNFVVCFSYFTPNYIRCKINSTVSF